MTRIRWSALVCALSLAIAGPAAADPLTPLLARTILVLKDHYVDPERFEPKRMALAGLDALAKAVDALVIERSDASASVTLRMGADVHELDLAGVTSIWALPRAMREALDFVEPRTSVPPADLEVAVVQGVLSTLDTHTMLLDRQATREMTTRIRGDQAGIGLVVGIRDGRLTVVRVLRGAVAERLGLKKGDVLQEVAGHSTAAAELQQVVEWLRGPVKSEVELVWIRGSGPPRRATVKREYVFIQPVSGTLLDGGVAYVRVTEFTGRAPQDLTRELKAQAARTPDGLRGVVLDLRGNPGGLLDAGTKVADLFLDSGGIVETVGPGGKVFDSATATASESDVAAPVVVLVDGQSAGSSEIVAAALRDHDRALVVGRRTFGLGTVQQVVDVDEEKTMQMKFTVAAYRSPAGTRFEAGGLEPDVVVRPGCIFDRTIRFFAPEPAAAEPVGVLTYLLGAGRIDAIERAWDPDSCAPLRDEDRSAEDPEVVFAADVLRQAGAPTRDGLRDAAARLLPARRAAEEAALTAGLARLGVDWSHAESGVAPSVNVTAAGPAAGAAAGAAIPWTVTVHNTGSAPLSRLRAWTVAPKAHFLDGRELVFGTIAPGAKKAFTLWLHPIGAEATPRRDDLVLRFDEENGHAPADVPLRFELRKVSRPRLALRVRVVCAGQRCSRLGAPGSAKVEVSLRNAGSAPSTSDGAVRLTSADERVYVVDGRLTPGPVAPGGQWRGQLAFKVLDGSGDGAIRFRLEAVDVVGGGADACDVELTLGAKLPATPACGRPAVVLTPDPDAAVLETTADTFALRGVATAGAPAVPLRSIIVSVDDRKVLVQPAGDDGRRIAFSTDLRLAPGEHVVLVSAETRSGAIDTKVMRIYRR